METWKEIPGTNGIYEASDLGNIRSIDRVVKHNYGGNKLTKGRALRQSKQSNGYLACPVFFDGKEKRCLVHRLIMLAFNGVSELTVNHKNGIKSDNRLVNLEYSTLSDNLKHAFKTGLKSIEGEKHPSSKLTNEQAKEIHNSKESLLILSSRFNVCQSAISNIKTGKTYANCR